MKKLREKESFITSCLYFKIPYIDKLNYVKIIKENSIDIFVEISVFEGRTNKVRFTVFKVPQELIELKDYFFIRQLEDYELKTIKKTIENNPLSNSLYETDSFYKKVIDTILKNY